MDKPATGFPGLSIRVVYVDAHLIEIEATVSAGGWSGVACAYTTPDQLRAAAERIDDWAEKPEGDCVVSAGADTGIGWVYLRFYEIDLSGHLVCHIQLSGDVGGLTGARPESVHRLSLEMRTEVVLIARFVRDLRAVADTLAGEANLGGVSS